MQAWWCKLKFLDGPKQGSKGQRLLLPNEQSHKQKSSLKLSKQAVTLQNFSSTHQKYFFKNMAVIGRVNSIMAHPMTFCAEPWTSSPLLLQDMPRVVNRPEFFRTMFQESNLHFWAGLPLFNALFLSSGRLTVHWDLGKNHTVGPHYHQLKIQ